MKRTFFESSQVEEKFNLTPPTLKSLICDALVAEGKVNLLRDIVEISFDTGHDRDYDGPGVGCTVFNGVRIVIKRNTK